MEERSNTLNAHATGKKFNLVIVVKFICTKSARMMSLYCTIIFRLVSLQRYSLWQSTVYGDYCP